MDRTVWLPPLTDAGGPRRLAAAAALAIAVHAGATIVLLVGAGPLSGVTNALAMGFFDSAISAEVVPLPRPEPVEPVPPTEQAAAQPQPTPPPEEKKKAEEEPPKPEAPPPTREADKPESPKVPDVAAAEPPPAVSPFAPLAAIPTPPMTPLPPQAPPAPPAPAIPQVVTQSTLPPPTVTAEEPPAGGGTQRVSDGFGERVPELPRPDRLPQIALAAPDDWSEVEPGDGAHVLLLPPEVLLAPELPRPPPAAGRGQGLAPPSVNRMATTVSRAGDSAGPAPYPWAARANNLEGDVLLQLRLAADGSVQEVTLLRSSGHAELDQAAARSVRGWRFKLHVEQYSGPAHISGHYVEVPISYRAR